MLWFYFVDGKFKKLCFDGLILLIYTATNFVVIEIYQSKVMAKAHLFPMPMKRTA